MSDRPEDRPVPPLARASARNARTRTAGRTDGTSTHRDIPARQPMSDHERETIRKAGAEDARRSRIANGLPERIEDPAAVAALAAILRRPPGESTSHERNRRHKPKAESGRGHSSAASPCSARSESPVEFCPVAQELQLEFRWQVRPALAAGMRADDQPFMTALAAARCRLVFKPSQ